MRVAMAQINPTVGDLDGNAGKIFDYIKEAERHKAKLVVFPELAVTGYPPLDLLREKSFVKDNVKVVKKIVKMNKSIVGVVGFVDHRKDKLFNAATVFEGDRIVGIAHKALLPTYDVFDEDRYFVPAKEDEIQPLSVNIGGRQVQLGVEICEDLWDKKYEVKVTDILVKRGAQVIINISASPFYVGKRFEREKLLKEKAQKLHVPIFYVNLVGGQDELVFDGQSMGVDAEGNFIAFGKQFQEDFIVVDIDRTTWTAPKVTVPTYCKEEEKFNALVLGIRDYYRKMGFEKAVVGMSGGIDSSLTTCIAVEALGKENVIGVSMPSKYSSEHSKTDAEKLANNLGICFVKFSINEIIESYKRTLDEPLKVIRKHFGVHESDDDPVADENIQPRTRANCLMDISNRLKNLKILVLNTGNKTELALGYCTLYGDMAGGIGALGDVNKLDVYKLARYVNIKAGREIIPENVFRKKPSPELKEGQFNPFDFDVVSPLVDEIIEHHRSRKELVRMGYPKAVVDDVYNRIRKSEYKRWQAVPCIKITKQAFGIGWRMPIVNKYKG
ncbi:NAD+ synthase [Candidatus Bathyarchaeota archaeon]|nr:NAD+ synthase [Candidatus Bathyarchaeota archaeon]